MWKNELVVWMIPLSMEHSIKKKAVCVSDCLPLVEHSGVEPLTSSMRTRRTTKLRALHHKKVLLCSFSFSNTLVCNYGFTIIKTELLSGHAHDCIYAILIVYIYFFKDASQDQLFNGYIC